MSHHQKDFTRFLSQLSAFTWDDLKSPGLYDKQMAAWHHTICGITIMFAFLLILSTVQTRPGKTRVLLRLDLLNYYSRGIFLTILIWALTCPMWCEELKLPENLTWFPDLRVLAHTHTSLWACSNRCPHFLPPRCSLYRFLPVCIYESFSSLFGFIVYSCCSF